MVAAIRPGQLGAWMVPLPSQQVQAATVTRLRTDGSVSTQHLSQGTVAARLTAPNAVREVITGAGTGRATGPFDGGTVGHWALLSLAGLPLGLRPLAEMSQALRWRLVTGSGPAAQASSTAPTAAGPGPPRPPAPCSVTGRQEAWLLLSLKSWAEGCESSWEGSRAWLDRTTLRGLGQKRCRWRRAGPQEAEHSLQGVQGDHTGWTSSQGREVQLAMSPEMQEQCSHGLSTALPGG